MPAEPTSDAPDHGRSRRLAIHGVLVAIDAPALAQEPWVVDAIDISSGGLGLVLPGELAEGTEVELSFKLGGVELSRVPAEVGHQFGTSGGVVFGDWDDEDRLALLEYLVRRYESVA